MADTKLTDKGILTTIATGDWFYTVDVSDTTSSAEGTGKRITHANVIAGLVADSDFSANGVMVRTSSGNYTNRTIIGTTNEITVNNGRGLNQFQYLVERLVKGQVLPLKECLERILQIIL
jgi:hypothetical protein